MEIINKNPIIFFISGKARHGKSTTGELLKEYFEDQNLNVAKTVFVKTLKMYAKDYFGWDGTDANKPRELLQTLGTEIIRKKLGKPDFFIKRTTEDIEILSYFFDVIIIDDLRFKSELEAVKQAFPKSIFIRINRPNFDNGLTNEQQLHSSELDLDNYDNFNYIIENNGSLNDLKNKVFNIAKKEMED